MGGLDPQPKDDEMSVEHLVRESLVKENLVRVVYGTAKERGVQETLLRLNESYECVSINSLDCGPNEEGTAISGLFYFVMLVIAMWGGGGLGGIFRGSGGVHSLSRAERVDVEALFPECWLSGDEDGMGWDGIG